MSFCNALIPTLRSTVVQIVMKILFTKIYVQKINSVLIQTCSFSSISSSLSSRSSWSNRHSYSTCTWELNLPDSAWVSWGTKDDCWHYWYVQYLLLKQHTLKLKIHTEWTLVSRYKYYLYFKKQSSVMWKATAL